MRRSFFLTALVAFLSLAESYSNSSFDYIIVGGGTAGLALANRLSGNFSVAVIEAEGFYQAVDNGTAQVPGLDILGAGMSPSDLVDTDWGFVTQPQKGANGRSPHYVRGECLDGRCVQDRRVGIIKCADNNSWQLYMESAFAKSGTVPWYSTRCFSVLMVPWYLNEYRNHGVKWGEAPSRIFIRVSVDFACISILLIEWIILPSKRSRRRLLLTSPTIWK
jgi:GMC oxidoreductase